MHGGLIKPGAAHLYSNTYLPKSAPRGGGNRSRRALTIRSPPNPFNALFVDSQGISGHLYIIQSECPGVVECFHFSTGMQGEGDAMCFDGMCPPSTICNLFQTEEK